MVSAARRLTPADITSQACSVWISLHATLRVCPWTTNATVRLTDRVPPSVERKAVVREYQPVVHRLRLSASA
jgi:hypothetical protein